MVRYAAVVVAIVVAGCTERQVCLAHGGGPGDCCPNESVRAAEDDLGLSTRDAFQQWQHLSFDAIAPSGAETVTIDLTRLATRSEGFQPHGDPPAGGTPMDEACDVGLWFEVRATVSIGDDVLAPLYGYLAVQDHTELTLSGTDSCGCGYILDAVLDPAPDGSAPPEGELLAECPPEPTCLGTNAPPPALEGNPTYTW